VGREGAVLPFVGGALLEATHLFEGEDVYGLTLLVGFLARKNGPEGAFVMGAEVDGPILDTLYPG